MNMCENVLRVIYDRKFSCKELRVFSMDIQHSEDHNEWVAYKSKVMIYESTLFSNKNQYSVWSEVDKFLLES